MAGSHPQKVTGAINSMRLIDAIIPLVTNPYRIFFLIGSGCLPAYGLRLWVIRKDSCMQITLASQAM